MQTSTIAALAAFGGALVALAVYHFAAVTPALRRLGAVSATHDELLGGGSAAATSRLSSLEDAARARDEHEGCGPQDVPPVQHEPVNGIGAVRDDFNKVTILDHQSLSPRAWAIAPNSSLEAS